MKKILLAFAAALACSAFALEVNEEELQSAGSEDVIRFENYTGPHSVVESASTISAIGTGLGKQVASAVDSNATFGKNQKYTVIHAVDPDTKEKLDADIIIINSNASVDHIKNLRRIIASYLESAYGYSRQDAATVATFVTVYNAVYRGKLDVFQSKYKENVTKNLSAEKCGLSTKYSDWPGNSQIVIPLYDVNGGLSTVDTSVISDKSVVQSMQEEDNRGVDERKNMVDIKEREAEAAEEKAQVSSKKAQEEEKKLAEQKEKEKKAQDKADQKQKVADEKKAQAQSDPSDSQAQKEAEEAQKEADQAQAEADEEAQNTQEQQEAADEAREEAEADQAFADKKADEAQEERQEIAQDQQELIQEAIKEAANPNIVVGLKITDEGQQLSKMVRVDGNDGSTLKESPVTVIRGRTILPVEGAVIEDAPEGLDLSLVYAAICGENTKNGAVKLCLLDAFKMEIQKESNETVSPDSVLVNNGSDYYCIIDDSGKYYLGKFDKNLKLLLKSQIEVNPATPVTVTSQGIIVTNAKGNISLLKLADLSEVNTSSSKDSTGYQK
ncbi:P83/100 family protein [Treponema sp.]|uniref:P83/100 family protein n=1 Tax=Treponema sp. TaxID=166 RepID=UPI0025F6238D|nr:P83/100 family protein [Treponema sp.]MCR5217777.1 hypothetical protein [Treponema sp.]